MTREIVSLPWGLSWLKSLKIPHKIGVLDRIYGGWLKQRGICVIETRWGVHWKLDLRNPTHRWCVYDSVLGSEVSSWLRTFLQPGHVVIDSGANIGQSVIEYLSLPGLEVHAFEPLEFAAGWIESCLNSNRSLDVRIVRAGLYNREDELPMQIAGRNEIQGAHSTLNLDWFADQNFERVTIKVMALSEYCDANDINSIRFWKLDVEGSELAALQGARPMLEDQVIDAILVEQAMPGSDSFQFLVGLGYEACYVRCDRVSRDSNQDGSLADQLFLSRRVAEQVEGQ